MRLLMDLLAVRRKKRRRMRATLTKRSTLRITIVSITNMALPPEPSGGVGAAGLFPREEAEGALALPQLRQTLPVVYSFWDRK